MKILVIFNAKAGQGGRLQEIEQAFVAQKAEVLYKQISPQLSRQVAEAKRTGVRCVVAAGGDGTVSAVAGLAQQHGLRLGVLPVGTLNHFAKDLHLPLEIAAAVEVITRGKTRRIDMASVNGHYFVNNSSIGWYPQLVRQREQHEPHLGKWPAALLALVMVMARQRRFKAILSLDGDKKQRTTPFVFVGNNSYRLRRAGFNNRARLDAGVLSVYWVNTTSFWGIMRVFWRALLGKPHPERDFESALAKNVVIALKKPRTSVATDGEVQLVDAPLEYCLHAGVLEVCAG